MIYELDNIRIMFVFPQERPNNGVYLISLGAAYLASYLKDKLKIFIHFFYGYDHNISYPKILEAIKTNRINVLGFTVFDTNLEQCLDICRIAKTESPNIITLFGGPSTIFRDISIISKWGKGIADICVRGEGEKIFLLLCENRFNPVKIADLPGITFINTNGELIQNKIEEKQVENDLDNYPSPILEDIYPIDYLKWQILKEHISFGIFSSRGCIYHCSYCQFSVLSNHLVRYHSIERIFKEVEKIAEIYKNIAPTEKIKISFLDEAITIKKKRITELCNKIINSNLDIAKLHFWAESRANYVNSLILELMSKAGFRVINFGLESATPHVLKEMKKCEIGLLRRKPDDYSLENKFLEQVEKATFNAKKFGMTVTVSIIVGYPNETIEEAQHTIEFCKLLPIELYYCNPLSFEFGTELYFKIKDQPGYLENNWDDYIPIPKYSFPLENLKHANKKLKNFLVALHGSRISLHTVLRTGTSISTYDETKYNNLSKNEPPHIFILPFYPDTQQYMNLLIKMIKLFGLSPVILFYIDKINNFNDLLMFRSSFIELIKHYRSSLISPTIFCLELNTGKIYNINSYPFDTKDILTRVIELDKYHLASNEKIKGFLELHLFKVNSVNSENIVKDILNKNIPDMLKTIGFDIIESCRFTEGICPAKHLSHLIILENGDVKPCFQANKIGNIFDENFDIYRLREEELANINEKLSDSCINFNTILLEDKLNN